jgi:hypothetical protein
MPVGSISNLPLSGPCTKKTVAEPLVPTMLAASSSFSERTAPLSAPTQTIPKTFPGPSRSGSQTTEYHVPISIEVPWYAPPPRMVCSIGLSSPFDVRAGM